MHRGYRYRLNPTSSQALALEHTLNLLRALYNAALQERRDAYSKQKINISKFDQSASLTTIRRECPEYKSIHSQVIQDVGRRVDFAFAAFFRRIKNNEKPGYPRFKTKDRYNSFTFPQAWRNNGVGIVSGSKRLRIWGVGNVKIRLHREMEGDLKTITIFRDSDGHWYANFVREVIEKILPKKNREVGLDLGLKSFIATSEGDTISCSKPYKNARIHLERASRKLSRRKIGSKRRNKARKLLAKKHCHVKNVRKDYHHKIARVIVKHCGFIAVENLNVAGLSRGFLSKSIHDAGWSLFLAILTYKAEEAGRELVRVNPYGTSQICSACGTTVAKDLSVRVHLCACGLVLDRDVNAARNILRLGQSLRGAASALVDRNDPRSISLSQ